MQEELDRWAARRFISQSSHRFAKSPRASIARSEFVVKAGREWTVVRALLDRELGGPMSEIHLHICDTSAVPT